jgi:hypothetical protein
VLDEALPQFVKDEFDAFLECGMLADGFLRRYRPANVPDRDGCMHSPPIKRPKSRDHRGYIGDDSEVRTCFPAQYG